MKALLQWALLIAVAAFALAYFVFAGGDGPCGYRGSWTRYACSHIPGARRSGYL